MSALLPCVAECPNPPSQGGIAVCKTGGLVASLYKFNSWPQEKD